MLSESMVHKFNQRLELILAKEEHEQKYRKKEAEKLQETQTFPNQEQSEDSFSFPFDNSQNEGVLIEPKLLKEPSKKEKSFEEVHEPKLQQKKKEISFENSTPEKTHREIAKYLNEYKLSTNPNFLKEKAQTLKITEEHLKLLLDSYNIILKIDQSVIMKQKQGDIMELKHLVNSELIQYLKDNPTYIKNKYFLKEMAIHIFRKFKFNLKTLNTWMETFYHRNKKEITQIQKSKLSSPISKIKPIDVDKQNIESEKKKILVSLQTEKQIISNYVDKNSEAKDGKKNKKKEKKKEKTELAQKQKTHKMSASSPHKQPKKDHQMNQIRQYPESYKKKVAEKLDAIFQKKIKEVLQTQSEQLCLSENALQGLYRSYGTYLIEKGKLNDKSMKSNI